MKRELKGPIFLVNTKAYICGQESLEFAKVVEAAAVKYDLDVFYTCQPTDIRLLSENVDQIFITAQTMSGIQRGRGTGTILPEAVAEAGADAVLLNHCEQLLKLGEIESAVNRAKELGMLTVVCTDTVWDCKSIAQLKPDVILNEPASLIGTGQTSDTAYLEETTAAIKSVDEDIFILQAAGVSTPEDVKHVVLPGVSGTGAASGAVAVPNRPEVIDAMFKALRDAIDNQ